MNETTRKRLRMILFIFTMATVAVSFLAAMNGWRTVAGYGLAIWVSVIAIETLVILGRAIFKR